jgi:tetratricopeptide (TPR) repeat protein
MVEDISVRAELAEWLKSHLTRLDDREALVRPILTGTQFETALQWEGPADRFTVDLVRLLPSQILVTVVRAAQRRVGVDSAEFVDNLCIRLETSTLPTNSGVPTTVPSQMPSPPPGFTGRLEQLDTLTAAIDQSGSSGTSPVIWVIAGAGGIGKTWLALHWAYQNIDRFPDGQLFANLNGFGPAAPPVASAWAVRGFLDAMAIPNGSIPIDAEAQFAQYRRLISDRRMLIILDNARDTAQVMPLLPASSTCTVVITSRNQLSSLVTAHGAQPMPLDVLNDAEARNLLAARLGSGRLAAEPEAVAELLRCCAGFPLALSIVAGRALTYPKFPLAELAAELREAASRLGALDDDDPAASLPAVLSWSYAALRDAQARLFNLLGVVPGPDSSLTAVANLADQTTARTRVLLRGLEQVSLVQQYKPGRYRMHDLIALYARDRADQDLTSTERLEARQRLVNYYLHTAYAADRLLHPYRPNILLDPPPASCRPQPLVDFAAALSWLDAEHSNLLAVQALASDSGWHHEVWQLSWTLDTYQWRRGHHHDLVASWQAGLAAAQDENDPAAISLAHRSLGHACGHVGRHADALFHLGESLTLAQVIGDRTAQAHTHHNLACAWEQQGENQRALEHAANALDLYRDIDEPVWQADALNDVGWYSILVGQYDRAHTNLQAALTLFRRHHHRDGEAAALANLGRLEHETGRPDLALKNYQQALTLSRALRNTYHEADILHRLGETFVALDDHAQARHVWQLALELNQKQHHTERADRIQQQLEALSTSSESVAPDRNPPTEDLPS